MSNLIECSYIHNILDDGINNGICKYFLNGIYSIWISQCVVSGSLFLIICCLCILYQYYSEFWNITNRTRRDKYGNLHADPTDIHIELTDIVVNLENPDIDHSLLNSTHDITIRNEVNYINELNESIVSNSQFSQVNPLKTQMETIEHDESDIEIEEWDSCEDMEIPIESDSDE